MMNNSNKNLVKETGFLGFGIVFSIVCIVLIAGMLQIQSYAVDTKPNNPDSKTNPAKNAVEAPKPLVTFIELGSVRCIPCKKMMPIVEELKKEYAGQVNVIFYDVWTPEGKPYAEKHNIRLIPTQVFLDKEGKEYFRHEGFFPKDQLIQVLKQKGVK